MTKQADAVKKWRKNTKLKLVDSFGSKCCVCGYDRCVEALEFHHLDPSEKDFRWGKINGNIRGWSTIITEIKKCVMVCSNCHKEVHAGSTIIPDGAQRLDESLISEERLYHKDVYDKCPVCNGPKLKANTTCSVACAKRNKTVIVDWKDKDIIALMKEHKTYRAVGELLGLTTSAVYGKYRRELSKH
jgi:hypothetical protein